MDRAGIFDPQRSGHGPIISHEARPENRTFYEFAEVKPRGPVFSFGSCFSFCRRTFHMSSPPLGSPARRLR